EILAKYNPEVLFLFIGDGQQRQEIENYIKEKEMENVKILPLMPKKDLVAFVQKSYFLLVPLAGKPILDTSSPNKLFDAFAAGIPVIQNTQGWIKELLANNNCGITIPADDFKMLADEIKRLLLNQELRDEMGRNAKRLGNTEFSRDFLAEKMHAIIRDVVNQK
ncbi:MAG: glycosyltransferase, partial [Bacteroidetes bacterium]|nr:glycosyltransferase [Bacteroidota bacterium]